MQDVRRRALIAGLVGLIGAFLGIAGAGHAYLRKWRRALAWFSLVLGVAIVLVTTFVDPATTESASSVWSIEMPLTVTIPMLVVQVLSAIDAYVVARRQTSGSSSAEVAGDESSATTTCPHCGRDVDPDLDFCHWCTEPLAEEERQPDSGQQPGSTQ